MSVTNVKYRSNGTVMAIVRYKFVVEMKAGLHEEN